MTASSLLITDRDVMERDKDTTVLEGSFSIFYFQVGKDKFFKAPDLNRRDEALVNKYLQNSRSNQLPPNLTQYAEDFLASVVNKYIESSTTDMPSSMSTILQH